MKKLIILLSLIILTGCGNQALKIDESLGGVGDMDVGHVAYSGTDTFYNGFTVIDLSNPANANGKVTAVDIRVTRLNSGDIKVGIFRGSGTTYTCVDYESLGDLSTGLHEDIVVDLDVQTGDFIGVYMPDNISIRGDYTGSTGIMYKSGDQTAAGSQAYTSDTGDWISLYGTGDSIDVVEDTFIPPIITIIN